MEATNGVLLILATALVLAMQGGFLCLESGLTRSKNSINVAIKNITDFGIATVFYWLLGYGIMFGSSFLGWFGTSNFAPSWEGESDTYKAGFFIFELVFCGTAATIVSGAVAERLKFQGYLIITLLVSIVIYPTIGHWGWNGLAEPEISKGWLEKLGFLDFAGSTIVHSTGGWVALAALLVIGPRFGRFDFEDRPVRINPSNLPMAMLGGIILWVGWIGFNGGSALKMDSTVMPIIMNTLIAAGAGLLSALAIAWLFDGYPDAIAPLNGSLAGLVAVTASCNIISAPSALLIGAIGGVLVKPTEKLLEFFKIDDAVGAIPVHLSAGIWGTLAVAIFGKSETFGQNSTLIERLGVQSFGILATGVFAFGVTFIILWILNKVTPLRVTLQEEKDGLNISEHKARTDLVDLLTVMEDQKKSGDLSRDVPVEPFTEIGQIAQRYNEVLGKVRDTLAENDTAREQIVEAFEQIAAEQVRAEKLLLNILPDSVAQELKENRNKIIAQSFQEVTILFADIVGFTSLSEKMRPEKIVDLLNRIVSVFDRLTDKYQLEKIKTIGDAYMVVGGLPLPVPGHAENVANFALEIQEQIKKFKFKDGKSLQMRVGIHTGPVVAGVIGEKKFVYDIWGDSVNTASRLESHGVAGKIQISERTASLIKDKFNIEHRGKIELKGKGSIESFFLTAAI
ncbi:MAG: ammonium transporter [Leptospiraceae bacterium]|nr:ammonium transporter [Leptospiraceae bacterium]